jgi:hypothetical protein
MWMCGQLMGGFVAALCGCCDFLLCDGTDVTIHFNLNLHESGLGDISEALCEENKCILPGGHATGTSGCLLSAATQPWHCT